MHWLDTLMNSAKVVYFVLRWDRSNEEFVGQPVRYPLDTLLADHPGEGSVGALASECACPDDARSLVPSIFLPGVGKEEL
jgi:hypothetical protein